MVLIYINQMMIICQKRGFFLFKENIHWSFISIFVHVNCTKILLKIINDIHVYSFQRSLFDTLCVKKNIKNKPRFRGILNWL